MLLGKEKSETVGVEKSLENADVVCECPLDFYYVIFRIRDKQQQQHLLLFCDYIIKIFQWSDKDSVMNSKLYKDLYTLIVISDLISI